MGKFILAFCLLSSSLAQANIFDFSSDESSRGSKIPELIKKMNGLEVTNEIVYEDSFNQLAKALENTVEEEKLYCSGEAQDNEGKTLPAPQRQLCMRELKKLYLKGTTALYELKRKYLAEIHKKQMKDLGEIQEKLKADIEKNF